MIVAWNLANFVKRWRPLVVMQSRIPMQLILRLNRSSILSMEYNRSLSVGIRTKTDLSRASRDRLSWSRNSCDSTINSGTYTRNEDYCRDALWNENRRRSARRNIADRPSRCPRLSCSLIGYLRVFLHSSDAAMKSGHFSFRSADNSVTSHR